MSMNTRWSGSARVDSTNVLPPGGVRGQTNFVKITEDVRKYAAEHGMSEEDALQSGMEQKSREFHEAGSAVYTGA
jgi:phosphomethylpyrimidine synthase